MNKQGQSYTFVIRHFGDSRTIGHLTVWNETPEAALAKVKRMISREMLVVSDWRGRPIEPAPVAN